MVANMADENEDDTSTVAQERSGASQLHLHHHDSKDIISAEGFILAYRSGKTSKLLGNFTTTRRCHLPQRASSRTPYPTRGRPQVETCPAP